MNMEISRLAQFHEKLLAKTNENILLSYCIKCPCYFEFSAVIDERYCYNLVTK